MVLEKTLESPLDCKEIQPVHPKGAARTGLLWGSMACGCGEVRVISGGLFELTPVRWRLLVTSAGPGLESVVEVWVGFRVSNLSAARHREVNRKSGCGL